MHIEARNTQGFHLDSVLFDLQYTFQTVTNLSLLCYWLALACYLDTIHIHTQSWIQDLRPKATPQKLGSCITTFLLLYTWVRASWIEFNNCPTRCDLFSLLHFWRQLYMFLVLTPIMRSSYNCNYSFWYWLNGSTTICSLCWVGTDSCASYGKYSCITNEYLLYDTHESVPTQQRERMVVDLVNQYQKLLLQLYELLMMGVITQNM